MTEATPPNDHLTVDELTRGHIHDAVGQALGLTLVVPFAVAYLLVMAGSVTGHGTGSLTSAIGWATGWWPSEDWDPVGALVGLEGCVVSAIVAVSLAPRLGSGASRDESARFGVLRAATRRALYGAVVLACGVALGVANTNGPWWFTTAFALGAVLLNVVLAGAVGEHAWQIGARLEQAKRDERIYGVALADVGAPPFSSGRFVAFLLLVVVATSVAMAALSPAGVFSPAVVLALLTGLAPVLGPPVALALTLRRLRRRPTTWRRGRAEGIVAAAVAVLACENVVAAVAAGNTLAGLTILVHAAVTLAILGWWHRARGTDSFVADVLRTRHASSQAMVRRHRTQLAAMRAPAVPARSVARRTPPRARRTPRVAGRSRRPARP